MQVFGWAHIYICVLSVADRENSESEKQCEVEASERRNIVGREASRGYCFVIGLKRFSPYVWQLKKKKMLFSFPVYFQINRFSFGVVSLSPLHQ